MKTLARTHALRLAKCAPPSLICARAHAVCLSTHELARAFAHHSSPQDAELCNLGCVPRPAKAEATARRFSCHTCTEK